MRHDKELAIQLRKNGKSYNEIKIELGVSKSTLCDWFKNEDWSKQVKNTNINNIVKLSTDRIILMNISRDLILKDKYDNTLANAKSEYLVFKDDPLFVAGLMLYDGEGDHLNKNIIRFANTDFGLHKVFINFCKLYLKMSMENIKFSILLYPDLNIDECMDKWCNELGIIRKNIYKPQVINGRLKTRKLHFGVGTSIILNSFLKHKLLYWINQMKIDLSK